MQLEEISSKLKAMEPELRARGLAHLAVFGSRARGNARGDSDLDLLLDINPDAKLTVLGLAGIERIVSEATGLEANTFLNRSLDEAFRESIEPDLRRVF